MTTSISNTWCERHSTLARLSLPSRAIARVQRYVRLGVHIPPSGLPIRHQRLNRFLSLPYALLQSLLRRRGPALDQRVCLPWERWVRLRAMPRPVSYELHGDTADLPRLRAAVHCRREDAQSLRHRSDPHTPRRGCLLRRGTARLGVGARIR